MDNILKYEVDLDAKSIKMCKSKVECQKGESIEIKFNVSNLQDSNYRIKLIGESVYPDSAIEKIDLDVDGFKVRLDNTFTNRVKSCMCELHIFNGECLTITNRFIINVIDSYWGL